MKPAFDEKTHEWRQVITFDVTQEDIDAARKAKASRTSNYCKTCVVAQGMNRSLGSEWHVTGSKAYDCSRPFTPNYRLSERAKQLVDDYDLGFSVSPGRFRATKIGYP